MSTHRRLTDATPAAKVRLTAHQQTALLAAASSPDGHATANPRTVRSLAHRGLAYAVDRVTVQISDEGRRWARVLATTAR